MKKSFVYSLVVAIGLFLSAPAWAHHGDAGHYNEDSVTLKGTVVQLVMVNPHTQVVFDVTDAGKTTLTEKLLLYGGAIHLAGAVKAKANQRNTTSDWMEIERQRGISISSSVLQFEYGGHQEIGRAHV